MKKNLPDLTIMMSVRVDSISRLENVKASLGYYRKHTNAHITIIESDKESKLKEFITNGFPGIEYIFIQDDNLILHRTKLMNIGFKHIPTANAANIDVDIIVPIEQLQSANELILKSNRVMGLPYDGRVVSVPSEFAKIFRKTMDIRSITEIDAYQQLMFGFLSLGGSYLVNVDRYRKFGLENENFLCWGPEDMERFHRLDILGYRPFKIPGKCYHLPHDRGINSGDCIPELVLSNKKEYYKVLSMSPKELYAYIKTWEWCH